MEETSIKKLDLRAPLVYEKTGNLPVVLSENDEFMLYYEMDPVQSCSIEPKPDNLLAFLIFSGKKDDTGLSEVPKVSIPAGMYLFTQLRSVESPLTQDKWLNLAIEQQKDGLWERYKLTNRLFIRFFHEDGMFVTQIFRPLDN